MIFRYRWFTCTEKNSELHKGNSKRFLYLWQSRSFSFPIRFSYETTLRAKEWGWENCLHVLSFPKGHVWICPCLSQMVILRWLSSNSNLKIHRSISHGSEYILLMYWSRGLLLWMVQRKSRFRNLKNVDGTTQEFVRFQASAF